MRISQLDYNNFVGVSAQGSANVQVNNSNISENLSTGFALSGAAGARIGRSAIVNNLGAATSGSVVMSHEAKDWPAGVRALLQLGSHARS